MIRLGCRCRVQLVKCINEAAQAKCLPSESARSRSDGNEPKMNFVKKLSGGLQKRRRFATMAMKTCPSLRMVRAMPERLYCYSRKRWLLEQEPAMDAGACMQRGQRG